MKYLLFSYAYKKWKLFRILLKSLLIFYLLLFGTIGAITFIDYLVDKSVQNYQENQQK